MDISFQYTALITFLYTVFMIYAFFRFAKDPIVKSIENFNNSEPVESDIDIHDFKWGWMLLIGVLTLFFALNPIKYTVDSSVEKSKEINRQHEEYRLRDLEEREFIEVPARRSFDEEREKYRNELEERSRQNKLNQNLDIKKETYQNDE